MGEVLDHIEAAIGEVSAARARVRKPKSRQVKASDELDALKAVAFAWFKTHRPHLGVTALDLTAVDTAYQVVLDATARFALRATYASAFKAALDALVAVRSAAAAAIKAPPASDGRHLSEAPPAFAVLSADPAMQAILNRRWLEVQRCISASAHLAATVMMGGLLESLLLARINLVQAKARIYTAKATPKDKQGKPVGLSEWKLVAMVAVAHELGWITKSAKDVGNVLRDFRNYVHPHKEHTDAVELGDEDVRMFWEVSKSITRQILASVGMSP